jgi:hypothetical protein
VPSDIAREWPAMSAGISTQAASAAPMHDLRNIVWKDRDKPDVLVMWPPERGRARLKLET